MSNGNKGTGVVVAVLVSLVVGGFGGYMLGNVNGQKAAQMEQQAVATVNGEKITKDDLYKRMVTEAGSQIVQQLIQEKLVDQEAAKANIEVAPAEIDAEIAKIREQVGGEQQLQAALAQNNLTMDQLRDIQVMRLKLEKILMPQIPMDDAALKAYFDENRAQFDKREVSARHILVATEAEAKAVREELDKGA
ncbi:MAG TPA: SurA N-terminal domain-containing protein, partial [Symbiobacteriaceae bacterium]|nr:SurA N-terminal domain-containing protein [Symbiobacteriaceae bacterium]